MKTSKVTYPFFFLTPPGFHHYTHLKQSNRKASCMLARLLLVTLVLINLNALAQTGPSPAQPSREVKGTVRDTLGNSVIAATIRLRSAKDSLMTRSDIDGNFIFKDVKASSFVISVAGLGYEPFAKIYTFPDQSNNFTLPSINVKSTSRQLEEVVINGTPPITVKEDTLIYRTKDYQLRSEALAEDLLKKLPGISVDQSGNVTAQGQKVTKVRINGKDFFGGDVKTATQNIPAELIDKVQIVDDYGDQANITGIKNGDPDKVLDIHIRPDKNKGYMGRATLGKGSQDRYQASAAVNWFNDTQQISALANFNNTNTPFFSAGSGGNPRFQQFFGGGAGNGISTLSSVGFNYRDDWGKKIVSYGSYSFSHNVNRVLSSTSQQNNYQGALVLSNQESDAQATSNTHLINWSIEYKIDTLNYLKISPRLNFNQNMQDGFASSLIQNNGIATPLITSKSEANTRNPSGGGNLLYNHRFLKRGRNISLELSLNSAANNQEQDVTTSSSVAYQHQLQYINSYQPNYTAKLSYLEPLSQVSFIELNYNRYYALYENERVTADVRPAGTSSINNALSNNYDFTFTTDRYGINYRVNQKRYNYYVGVGLQPAVLHGEANALGLSTRRTELRIIPAARFSYNFAKTRSLNINFSGKSTEPAYTYLQPSIDISNPQFPVQGNPYLKPEFNQTLRIRYNNFDFSSGKLFLGILGATYTDNKITSNTVRLNDISGNLIQQTNYLNTDGYYTANGMYLWSIPLAEKKYVISFDGSITYNNNISYSDEQRNRGRNWVFTQNFTPQVSPYQWLEINPGIRYTYNMTSNDLLSQTDTRVSTWAFSFNSKTYIHKTWLVGSDMSKQVNIGYNRVGVNPFILNLYLEKQFLKGNRASFRLQGFDLLDQNTNISRTVTANSIIDSRTNQLGRYFMFSFTLRLQRFNGSDSAPPMMPPGDQRRGRGRGGMDN